MSAIAVSCTGNRKLPVYVPTGNSVESSTASRAINSSSNLTGFTMERLRQEVERGEVNSSGEGI
jgi:hypothetical protein